MKHLFIAAAAVAALAGACAVPAHASLIFTLTQDGCSGGCGPGPYGTITLDQGANSSTVIVTETCRWRRESAHIRRARPSEASERDYGNLVVV